MGIDQTQSNGGWLHQNSKHRRRECVFGTKREGTLTNNDSKEPDKTSSTESQKEETTAANEQPQSSGRGFWYWLRAVWRANLNSRFGLTRKVVKALALLVWCFALYPALAVVFYPLWCIIRSILWLFHLPVRCARRLLRGSGSLEYLEKMEGSTGAVDYAVSVVSMLLSAIALVITVAALGLAIASTFISTKQIKQNTLTLDTVDEVLKELTPLSVIPGRVRVIDSMMRTSDSLTLVLDSMARARDLMARASDSTDRAQKRVRDSLMSATMALVLEMLSRLDPREADSSASAQKDNIADSLRAELRPTYENPLSEVAPEDVAAGVIATADSATAALSANQFRTALDCYSRLVDLQPDNPIWLDKRGSVHHLLGMPEYAERDWKGARDTAIAKDTCSAEALKHLGIYYYNKGSYEESSYEDALSSFRDAIDCDRLDMEARKGLLRTLLMKGYNEEFWREMRDSRNRSVVVSGGGLGL